jgi:LTXXQ motif family protein
MHALVGRLKTIGLLSVAVGALGCVSDARAPESARSEPVSETAASAVAGESELDAETRQRYSYFAKLQLSIEQLKAMDAIRDRMLERVASANAQRLAFQDSMLGAMSACDPDYARLRIEGRRMIDAAPAAKPAVLDAINELHAVLTPEQRRLAVDPVLKNSEERRQRSDDDGFAKMAKKLDLGVGQALRMAKRARNRITLRRTDRDALRDSFDEAAKSFREPDFDAHQVAFAKEPLVAHTVQFIFDLAAIVLPELEPPQCAAIADFASEALRR